MENKIEQKKKSISSSGSGTSSKRNSKQLGLKPKIHPVDKASWFSYITFTWISSFMFSSHRNGLDPAKIPFISPQENCEINTDRLEALWAEDVKEGMSKLRFGKTIWKYVKKRVILTSIVYLSSVVIGFISPTICMRKLLEFSSNPDAKLEDGIIWVSLLVFCELLRVLLFTLTWALGYRTSIRLRTACMGLTYRKLLRLGNISESTASTITNVIANDCGRIYDVIVTTQVAIGGPLVLLLSTIFITYELGPLSLCGILVFPLFYPIQYLLARGSGSFRRSAIHIQDARVTLMSQALQHLKFLKMFAWEKFFRNKIADTRLLEKKFIQRAQMLLSMSVVIAPTLPHIGAIITFILFINSGNQLFPAQAFCIVALFGGRIRPTLNKLRAGFRAYFDSQIAVERLQCFTIFFLFSLFGYSIRSVNMIFENIYTLRIFTDRMNKKILSLPEIKLKSKNEERKEDGEINNNLNAIEFVDTTVSRLALPDSEYLKKSRRKSLKSKFKDGRKATEKLLNEPNEVIAFQLDSINLSIRKGAFIGICGQVGSGKSTFLQTIAGALSVDKGTLRVNGKIAYAPQEPWIFRGTLRENVIFGEEFDSVRYYSTINACCLINDFGILPHGDLTMTSENGSNLSGGQKNRLSLARALYFASSRDIFLLDDPYSSLDARVSKTIHERVILGGLRNNENITLLLVTHQVQFLKECHEILVFSEGKIVERGSHNELVGGNHPVYASLLTGSSTVEDEENNSEITTEDSEILDCSNLQQNNQDDEVTEDGDGEAVMTSKGGMPWSVFRLYVDSAGGPLAALVVFLAFGLSIGSTTFSSWWLKQWFKPSLTPTHNNSSTTQSQQFGPEVIDQNSTDFIFNRNVYLSIIALILVTSIFRTLLFVLTSIKASQGLHSYMLSYFFRNRLKSSEKIGTGQILNLFSKDMEQVDTALPSTMEFFLQNIFIVISILGLVTLVFPLFLIPLLVLFIIFIFVRRIYNSVIRDLKRLESEAKTPIFTRVRETVTGIATIRAFCKEEQMMKGFNALSDDYHSIFYTFNAAVRWLSIRLDALAVSVTAITAIFILIFHKSVGGSSAGLALAYAAQLSGIFQFTVRLATDTQARFVSVERIRNFLLQSQPEEPELFEFNKRGRLCKNSDAKKLLALRSLTDIHPNWPTEGHVKFDAVYMSYSLLHEAVLKDLSFEAYPGQKIGIIGRTGSGKSSIGSALFRLTELKSGTISIDGVDITQLPLSKLRNSLCVIPQEAAIFQQSIRLNLDPEKQSNDFELWKVLEKTGLKSVVDNLDAEVGLSQGQRQLLSIARALLRRAKVLFVDEATSSVDNETSALIDRLLVEEFTESTVFIIAHRIKSLSYCDFLLIMENGQLRDFGPVAIISKKPSFIANFEKFETLSLPRP